MTRTTMIFAIAFTLFAAAAAYPQKTVSKSSARLADDTANSLTGVWESVAPAEVDCKTRVPLGPDIRALYTFNFGGTMNVEDTLPIEGPFRSTGSGVWERVSGRTYRWVKMHYSFVPNTTIYQGTIRARGTLTVSLDGNSFTQAGTFEVLDAGTQTPIYNGCWDDTAYRMNL